MKMTKRIIPLFIFMILTSGVFAKQISIQVVQKNVVTDTILDRSLSIEEDLLDGFFKQGYIVTNSVAVSSKTEDDDLECWHKGFGEAFDGFSDYFVQLKIYYSEPKTDKKGKTVRDIKLIDYNITNVKTGENLESFSEDYSTSFEDYKKISVDLVNKINRVIKAKA